MNVCPKWKWRLYEQGFGCQSKYEEKEYSSQPVLVLMWRQR